MTGTALIKSSSFLCTEKNKFPYNGEGRYQVKLHASMIFLSPEMKGATKMAFGLLPFGLGLGLGFGLGALATPYYPYAGSYAYTPIPYGYPAPYPYPYWY